MKILILGGTRFLGRSLVDAALAGGHDVTLFNRGQSNPDLFPDVEKLRGDRDGDLSALEGGKWDAVIDTSGYIPRIVQASADLLATAVKQYVFISSISVYPQPLEHGISETHDVIMLDDPTVEEVGGETYGGLKVLCEHAVQETLPGRSLIIRSGLIVGPFDTTDRFTYWPVRIARGDEVLVPPEDAPIQVIDVRDLTAWIIDMVEQNKTGIYNATGPAGPLTFGAVTKTANEVAGNHALLIDPGEHFLVDQHVSPWTDLPLWLPEQIDGMAHVSISKAISDGLTFRSIRDTIRDTLDWYTSNHDSDAELKAGHSPDREAELLAAWHAENSD